jgi:hypothetical protein
MQTLTPYFNTVGRLLIANGPGALALDNRNAR